jgi:uncharacterized membrane protein
MVLWTFVPAVAADNGLEVTTPYPAVAVAPGTKVSFDLKVSSTRNANVALEMSGVPEGWTASLLGGGFVVDGVSVTASTDGEVRLDVDVPADAPEGTTTMRLTARGGGAQDVLPISIRTNAEAAGDVALTVSVTATGPDGWDVSASLTGEEQAASTVVDAGATQNITVTAKAGPDIAAGTYPIKVEARAGDRTASADLGIEVTGSYSMTLSTPNDLLSASGSAGSPTTQAFVVENTGTAPLTEVALTATPPTDWTVTTDPETLPAIPPGQTATITATITPSWEAVAGDYVVTFNAKAAESGADETAQIRFTVETSPLWALVGLGLIVLILAGLFYVFRTYGRR